MKQKFVVSHDDYGHFFLAKLDDRKTIWKFLTQDLESGDAWANLENRLDNDGDVITIDYPYGIATNNSWEDFVNEFNGRGRLEIIEIEI